MLCFLRSTASADMWSVCSWVMKTALIFFISYPARQSVEQSVLALFPASISMSPPSVETSMAFPDEPE